MNFTSNLDIRFGGSVWFSNEAQLYVEHGSHNAFHPLPTKKINTRLRNTQVTTR